MRASATLAILLVCAIAQSQAFYSLLDSQLLAELERRPGSATGREAGEPVDAEAAAEQQEGEVTEPVGVTQRDITLLRRDILISLERLRRTLERMFSMMPPQHLNLRHPDEFSARHHSYHPSGEH